ncbi:MAG: hypothetical protein IPO36_11200 [Anaerolineales bacterium]|nr:hypothetical protein [Anaerolineales bacterium]
MPLKPEGPYPNLKEEIRQIASQKAEIIEEVIQQFAIKQYGKGIELARFTEIVWHLKVKTNLFEKISSAERSIVLMTVGIPSFDASYIEVGFFRTNKFPTPSDEIMRTFCKTLSSRTRLGIRCWANGSAVELS